MPPLIGPDPFIGREREMAELTAALDGALEGRGGARCSWANPGKRRYGRRSRRPASKHGTMTTTSGAQGYAVSVIACDKLHR